MKFSERATYTKNPVAKRLFSIMEKKKSPLGLVADKTKGEEIIDLAERFGPHIALFKTHIDIVSDFSGSLIKTLKELSEKHSFLLFEDRKFADIGNTVKEQYCGGMYQIASYAHITNAHIIAGEGTILALERVGSPLDRALLLIAEMSSKGNLLDAEMSKKAVAFANKYPNFVIGFITQKKISDDPRHIHITPGIHRQKQGDTLLQGYKTPKEAILTSECDLLLLGRAVLEENDPLEALLDYKEESFEAYRKREESIPKKRDCLV